MKRAALPILAAITLAAPAAAVAAPLSVARGRAAITRYESRDRFTISDCRRPIAHPGVVACRATGQWRGWTVRVTDYAVQTGDRIVVHRAGFLP